MNDELKITHLMAVLNLNQKSAMDQLTSNFSSRTDTPVAEAEAEPEPEPEAEVSEAEEPEAKKIKV